MIDSELFRSALELVNETLTATIVIISASILLYNVAHRSLDRVARSSAIVLACVTMTYLGEVFLSLEPGDSYVEIWLRFQWIGIGFVPAAILHLSDALLATTGRPSRGRRRTVVQLSYVISLVFTTLALTTDAVIKGPEVEGIPRMVAGPVFGVYVAYLLVIATFSMVNVVRARRRCLTRYTRRRMTYLMAVFLTPAYGIFPYTLLFGGVSEEKTSLLLVILNLANVVVVAMLVFMAYPLSFFGTEQPDRVIKSRLLEFMLRGPLTGTAILAVILFVPRASNVLGLNGEELVPFSAVAVLLFLQWSITLLLPLLQRWFVYTTDQQRAQWIQQVGERLLTEADAAQLLESILAAICDQLRVPTAFVAKFEDNEAKLVQIIGSLGPSPESLTDPELAVLSSQGDDLRGDGAPSLRRSGLFLIWHSYWIAPLPYDAETSNGLESPLLGILGIWARAPEPNLTPEEEATFRSLARQTAQVLADLQRQSKVFVLLEGIASQMDALQQFRGVSRYGHVSEMPTPPTDIISDPEFSDAVKDALRDYWGGPKLTESQLLHLNIVWREMESSNSNSPVRALRNVLARAIENLRPEGQRSLTTSEWILYNILEMRFLQGRKVRDVALRLAMSESDLYRKQRIAIEEVAHQIQNMERGLLTENGTADLAPHPSQNATES